MPINTNFLIIGAGPFGLSMSAFCLQNSINHIIVGKSMDFWKNNMPTGMKLRSAFDWHLDPGGIDTFEKFMHERGSNPDDYRPVPLELYLEYADWFSKQKNINPINNMVTKLDYDEANSEFTAEMDNGEEIISKNVLLAVGFKYFKNIPTEFSKQIPEDKYTHTCDIKSFDRFKDKRCLIVGGRMSAFESAALLNESGAKEVYMSFRHNTPEFIESEWDWVTPLLEKMAENPDWYINLDESEKDKIGKRFFGEGRLKMEPWLKPRLEHIHILPDTEINEIIISENNGLKVNFNCGDHISVDHVILATGYKVNINDINFINKGNILETLKANSGYPELDSHMQTSIPGLYATSMLATRDFGLFFGFTVSVNTSSKIIGKHMLKKKKDKNDK